MFSSTPLMRPATVIGEETVDPGSRLLEREGGQVVLAADSIFPRGSPARHRSAPGSAPRRWPGARWWAACNPTPTCAPVRSYVVLVTVSNSPKPSQPEARARPAGSSASRCHGWLADAVRQLPGRALAKGAEREQRR